MRNCILPNEQISAIRMQENSIKPDLDIEAITDLEARIAELEMELIKQKAAAEKGAKLMQIIWGDKFQSDSLH